MQGGTPTPAQSSRMTRVWDQWGCLLTGQLRSRRWTELERLAGPADGTAGQRAHSQWPRRAAKRDNKSTGYPDKFEIQVEFFFTPRWSNAAIRLRYNWTPAFCLTSLATGPVEPLKALGGGHRSQGSHSGHCCGTSRGESGKSGNFGRSVRGT